MLKQQNACKRVRSTKYEVININAIVFIISACIGGLIGYLVLDNELKDL